MSTILLDVVRYFLDVIVSVLFYEHNYNWMLWSERTKSPSSNSSEPLLADRNPEVQQRTTWYGVKRIEISPRIILIDETSRHHS